VFLGYLAARKFTPYLLQKQRPAEPYPFSGSG